MNRSGVEVRDVVEEFVFDAVGDVVPVGDCPCWWHGDVEVGSESMAFPPHSDLLDGADSGCMHGDLFDVVDERRVDAVHETAKHLDDRDPQHRDDRDGDDESGDRVGAGIARPDADGAGNDGE